MRVQNTLTFAGWDRDSPARRSRSGSSNATAAPGRRATFLLREVLRDHGPLPHDLVLVDCPPQLGLLTTNALTAADALVVTR